MIVVSDSSPLIALARIRKLELLAALFERIVIPAEVHGEVIIEGRGLPGAEEVSSAAWIEVAPPCVAPQQAIWKACDGLGAGERGAIVLAKSLQADLTLIDERKGRQVAAEVGLSVAGCIGVLESGARRGLVPDLRGAYVSAFVLKRSFFRPV